MHTKPEYRSWCLPATTHISPQLSFGRCSGHAPNGQEAQHDLLEDAGLHQPRKVAQHRLVLVLACAVVELQVQDGRTSAVVLLDQALQAAVE